MTKEQERATLTARYSVPTVRIEHEDFPEGVLINARDFDEDEHILFSEKPAAKPEREKLTLPSKASD